MSSNNYNHRFDCWYKDVCNKESCDGCIRFLEMSYLMEASDIPITKQVPISLKPDDIDYERFVRLSEIKNDIVNFVTEGENLYLSSQHTGNGKTSWAIKLMLKYFDSIWAGNGLRARGMFVHVPTLIMRLKNFESPVPEEYKNYLLNLDLIIWDDIGHSEISKYDYSNLLMLIDNRLLSEKSNIFTSNLTRKSELDKLLGVKISSRIWNTSTRIELEGEDKR